MTPTRLLGRVIHRHRIRGVRSGRRPLKRVDILNHLVLSCGYRDYLEIGVRKGSNFRRVLAPTKVGVDPDPGSAATRKVTSDEYFQEIAGSETRFDLVFVDGLHLEEQARKDVENALRHLRDDGAIVLHDCNPIEEEHQVEEYNGVETWNGTVWKAIARFRMTRTDMEIRVVDTDHGCGIIRRGRQEAFVAPMDGDFSYAFLAQNRAALLNLISPLDFLSGSPCP